MNPRPSMLMPAAIGGSVFGLLAGLPLIHYVNCACCALVMGGGFFAGWLYSRSCAESGAEFRPGNGALLGLVAAPFYAVLATISTKLFQSVSPEQIEEMVSGMEQGGAPPEFIDFMVKVVESGWVLSFVIGIVVALIFSTVGGLIAGAVFKVEGKSAAASTPPSPPAAP